MSYGYSQRLADACNKAESDSVGVLLGRLCIERKVSVNEVAKKFSVSRSTVYNWFWGLHKPNASLKEQILLFIEQLSARKQ
jgi:DNA invertase Pin-like site-specific DNA recombinase